MATNVLVKHICARGLKYCPMIRYRLPELIADLEFKEKRRVTLEEVADATGIHRTTLSKIQRQHGYNTTTDNLDALCGFFGCSIEKLVEYVPTLAIKKRGRKG